MNIFNAMKKEESKLPLQLNVDNYVGARLNEINVLLNLLESSKKSKQLFQELPRHLRRRVMSHTIKRTPRKLRNAHKKQLLANNSKIFTRKKKRRKLKSSKPFKVKSIHWLETHMWHAKRFHMTNLWGYRLPLRACDKNFRALYRASAKHCLLQDVSYYCCIEIRGPLEILSEKFKLITNIELGPTILAKCYLDGTREGKVMFYHPSTYPYKAIGKVQFLWKPIISDQDERVIWIWVHPSIKFEILKVFQQLFSENNSMVMINDLSSKLNRFRLTGPLSIAILKKCFKTATMDNVNENNWLRDCFDGNDRKQNEFWMDKLKISCPSQLPPHSLIGLNILDPRFCFPSKRTKAILIEDNINAINQLEKNLSKSYIWDERLRDMCLKDKLSDHQINQLNKDSLVKGIETQIHCKSAAFPCVLIQRPGNMSSGGPLNHENLGYNSGFDVILPRNWGMPLWRALVLWGARVGGLRETRCSTVECLNVNEALLPDTHAGQNYTEILAREKYVTYLKRPPKTRTNYFRMKITCPFMADWKLLLSEWNSVIERAEVNENNDFYVIRNKKYLSLLNDYLLKSKKNCFDKSLNFDGFDNCLVAVKLILISKGKINENAVICLPTPDDLRKFEKEQKSRFFETIESIKETIGCDPNSKLRQTTRIQHKKMLKLLRNKRQRLRRELKECHFETNETLKLLKQTNLIKRIEQFKLVGLYACEKFKYKMRELWLPFEKFYENEDISNNIKKIETELSETLIENLKLKNEKKEMENMEIIKTNDEQIDSNENNFEKVNFEEILKVLKNEIEIEFKLDKVKKQIRYSCSREICGFVQEGDFSFVRGCSTGVGYIALNSLKSFQTNLVLVRNPTNLCYRFAELNVIL